MKIPAFDSRFASQLDKIKVVDVSGSYICFLINDLFLELDVNNKAKIVNVSQYAQIQRTGDLLTGDICLQTGHLGTLTEEQLEVFNCIWFSHTFNIKVWE